MVQALHEAGISVVMDVVYNHVHSAEEFCINKLVPGYFSRINEDGSYSSGSGCGNDMASERSMVRKYIVDSVSYWADEMFVIFNANKETATVALPEGNWNVYINGSAAGTTVLGSFVGEAQVEPITAMVLIREGEAPQKETETTETEVSAEPVSATEPAEPEQSTGRGIWIVIGCVGAAALCGLAVVLNQKNKRK